MGPIASLSSNNLPANDSPEEEGSEDDRLIDDRLIDASLAGDGKAYGQLVDRYQDRLRNSLRGLTGSLEEAEDVAQEAFMQAYLKLDTFQRTARFFTWLYRIAFNLAISKSRKKRPLISYDAVKESGAPDPVAAIAQPEEASVKKEEAKCLHEAIKNLSDEYRQVLVLREFEGYDYQQIAEKLDMPVGTVRSRLFRARARLKDLVQPFV